MSFGKFKSKIKIRHNTAQQIIKHFMKKEK